MFLFKSFASLAIVALSQQASLIDPRTGCGENQVFQTCAAPCQYHCPKYNAAGDLIDIAPFCAAMCVAKCVCADSYVQDPQQGNLCVLRSECTPPLPFTSDN